jgi:hypothetical protein
VDQRGSWSVPRAVSQVQVVVQDLGGGRILHAVLSLSQGFAQLPELRGECQLCGSAAER